ncbi:VPS10 domain-containing protein [Plasmodiophora brassicae]
MWRLSLAFVGAALLVQVVVAAGTDDVDTKAIEKIVRDKIVEERTVQDEVSRVAEAVKKEMAKPDHVDDSAAENHDQKHATAPDHPAPDAPAAKRKDKKAKKDGKRVAKKLAQSGDDVDLKEHMSKLDGGVAQMEWLAADKIVARTNAGRVYRSADDGRTWDDVRLHMPDDAKKATFDKLYAHVERQLVVLLGDASSAVSSDGGSTFRALGLDRVTDVKSHPEKASWLLALALTAQCRSGKTSDKHRCVQQVHVSEDLGQTWNAIADYVSQADWARGSFYEPGSPRRLFATVSNNKHGGQRFQASDPDVDFVMTDDYFQSYDVLVPGGNRFLTTAAAFMFVAAVDPDDNTKVTLYSGGRDSANKVAFFETNIPTLRQHSYTILDSTEGAVFVHVNHADAGDSSGSVYVSDSLGLQFSMSLPNNRRDAAGNADFERVQGIEGVYLANYVHHEDSDGAVVNRWLDAGSMGARGGRKRAGQDASGNAGDVRTVISFDKGGRWSYLQAPQYDAFGQEIHCWGQDHCHLHLHGIVDKYGPFYSNAAAVGLIMATGTVGTHLNDDAVGMGTYLSRDAGLTWEEVARGSYIYEFGNHGGLIVMAQDAQPTTTVLYTWDQGLTWNEYAFASSPIEVDNVVVAPAGFPQTTFLVYGHDNADAVVVRLDLAGVHERPCDGADYETWTPSDDRPGKAGECLLGHITTYTRRKRTASCIVSPAASLPKADLGHCPCTERDFECDVGFGREDPDGPCVPVDAGVDLSRDLCATTGMHRITKGYRRIVGDTCVNGEQWDAVLVGCSSFPKRAGKVLLVVLFIIAALLLAVSLIAKSNVLSTLTNAFKSRTWRAKVPGQKGSMDESEFENFGAMSDEDDALAFSSEAVPLPPMPGLVRRPNVPVPRLQGPSESLKDDLASSEA